MNDNVTFVIVTVLVGFLLNVLYYALLIGAIFGVLKLFGVA